MTHREALDQIISLRPQGLSTKQFDAWLRELLPFHPEDILRAGRKVALSWTYSTGWPLGAVTQLLAPAEKEALEGFYWDVFTGTWHGSWEALEKLSAGQREAIARHVLEFKGKGDLFHEETAEKMWPGITGQGPSPYDEENK